MKNLKKKISFYFEVLVRQSFYFEGKQCLLHIYLNTAQKSK